MRTHKQEVAGRKQFLLNFFARIVEFLDEGRLVLDVTDEVSDGLLHLLALLVLDHE